MKKFAFFTLVIFLFLGCTQVKKDPYTLSFKTLETQTKVSLRAIQSIDDSTIWACGNGGTILKSMNGGQSWTVLTIPGHESSDFRDIHVFDQKKVVVMSIGSPAKIFRTNNGGKSWWLTYFNNHPDIFLDGMAFWDKKTGIAFGDAMDNKIPILKTSDGGNSWQMLPDDNLPVALPNEGGFAASGTSIITHGDQLAWIGLGFPRGRILKSVDQGNTWDFYLSNMGNNDNSRGIYSLAFKDEKTGLAAGGSWEEPKNTNLTMAFTQNGGHNFSIVTEHPPGGYRSAVAFVPGKDLAVCCGTNGIDISFDQGKSWRSAYEHGFNALAFSPSGKTGYACGSMGSIVKIQIHEPTSL